MLLIYPRLWNSSCLATTLMEGLELGQVLKAMLDRYVFFFLLTDNLINPPIIDYFIDLGLLLPGVVGNLWMSGSNRYWTHGTVAGGQTVPIWGVMWWVFTVFIAMCIRAPSQDCNLWFWSLTNELVRRLLPLLDFQNSHKSESVHAFFWIQWMFYGSCFQVDPKNFPMFVTRGGS